MWLPGARAATQGRPYTHSQVVECTNLLWFDLAHRVCSCAWLGCRIRDVTNSSSSRGRSSSYAHRLRHAQLGHPIEYRAFYLRFRALGRQAPRPEPFTEEHLESKHGILGHTLPRIAAEHLPG